jgi:hypothetical protein
LQFIAGVFAVEGWREIPTIGGILARVVACARGTIRQAPESAPFSGSGTALALPFINEGKGVFHAERAAAAVAFFA